MARFNVFSYDKNFKYPICLGRFNSFKTEKQVLDFVKERFAEMPEYPNIIIKKERIKSNGKSNITTN